MADPYRIRDPARRCPDCGVPLQRINVVDRGDPNHAYVGFDFTVDHEAPRLGAFDKVVNTSGIVHGYLCPAATASSSTRRAASRRSIPSIGPR